MHADADPTPQADDPDSENLQQEQEDLFAELARRDQQRAGAARASFGELCGPLAELGVSLVFIDYDGCGDSGAIESVEAIGRDAEGQLPPLDVETVWSRDRLAGRSCPFIKLPADLGQRIQEATEDLLPSGREIDCGSCGLISVLVEDRKLQQHHYWRYEATEYQGSEDEL